MHSVINHKNKKIMQTNSELSINQELKEKVKEICVQYGLDFLIEKEPLKGSVSDRETKFFGLFNSNTGEALCTVKENYRVTQTYEVVTLVLTAIMDIKNLRITKAGSLNGGRKIFIQLAVEGFSKVGNELIERYITVIDSNDKTHCLGIHIGNVTLSCSNQFSFFYKKSQEKFSHANTIEKKLELLPQMIKNALDMSENQIQVFNELGAVSINENDIHQFVKEVLGYDREFTTMEELSKKTKKSIEKMDFLYESIERELESKSRTLYGLFNGLTYFTTHHVKPINRHNGLDESLLIGKANNLNRIGFEWCMKKVNRS